DPTGGGGGGDGLPAWLAATDFGRFLDKVAAADEDDRTAMVDAYLAGHERFPLIEPGGIVHFVYRGEAEDVGIIGDMIGFRREDPMNRVAGTDFFHYSMRLEPDAAVSYGFIPSFERPIADPLNPAPSVGLFGPVSFLAMPAWEPPVATPASDGATGLVEVEWQSGAFEGPRQMAIYLPPGYETETDRRYPVAYVHGGGERIIAPILDRVVGDTVEPLIVVFVRPNPENPRADMNDPEQYLRMFTGEAVPKVEADYRTINDRMARATMGAAEGGNGALHSAFLFPDLFGKVASQGATLMSPSEVGDILVDSDERTYVIWHGWGTYHLRSPHEGWDMAESARQLHQTLRDRGYRPTGGESPDGFGWSIWSALADDWFEALFPLH
ncbi:MAG: alpha/beta hydrolase-fold protein, partial [Acidobacteriota bacterium]